MAVLLGRTTAGTVADGIPSSDAAAWRFTAVASGDLGRIHFEPKVVNAGLTSVELGVYTHSGALPAALLGSALATAFTGTADFYADLASVVAIVSGTDYWLAIQPEGENFDWQGTSGANYNQRTGISALPASWTTASDGGSWNNLAIIWGETAPLAAPILIANTLKPMTKRN